MHAPWVDAGVLVVLVTGAAAVPNVYTSIQQQIDEGLLGMGKANPFLFDCVHLY